MNVKNKIIALVMSFIICFGTVSNSFANDKERLNNFQPLVVDGGIISAPMLATVAGLAVGTGIVLKNNDDIYDIGRIFYEYIESQKDLTWDFVTSAFATGHVLINDVVNVKSGEFLDIVKGFFSSVFPSDNVDTTVGCVPGFGYPTLYSFADEEIIRGSFKISNTSKGNVSVYHLNSSGSYVRIGGVSASNTYYKGFMIGLNAKGQSSIILVDKYDRQYAYSFDTLVDTISIPYSGTYNPGILEEKEKEDGSIDLPIPGNLGNLVGQGSTDFWGNTDGLVGGGSISLPSVDNPSIGVTEDVFVGSPSTDLPGVENPSIPNEGIWATIKDFVVSLVVPSDTFWTDTFLGFRDNFTKNFPMVDMSRFDELVVGGKPFPNIYAFNSKIVDGDVINSIVDWLRPIIAGFIMLCLMFFNYRKIYKLIRNSEPFDNLGGGSSDFRTGISEYADYKQSLREYRAFLAKRGGN